MMKTRKGFVSNSSSSSFVVVTKKAVLNKRMLEKVFGTATESIFSKLIGEAAETFFDLCKPLNHKDLENEYGCKNLKEFFKDSGMKTPRKYHTIYTGCADSDGETEEQILCELDINYEDENVIIKKEGGY